MDIELLLELTLSLQQRGFDACSNFGSGLGQHLQQAAGAGALGGREGGRRIVERQVSALQTRVGFRV